MIVFDGFPLRDNHECDVCDTSSLAQLKVNLTIVLWSTDEA